MDIKTFIILIMVVVSYMKYVHVLKLRGECYLETHRLDRRS